MGWVSDIRVLKGTNKDVSDGRRDILYNPFTRVRVDLALMSLGYVSLQIARNDP